MFFEAAIAGRVAGTMSRLLGTAAPEVEKVEKVEKESAAWTSGDMPDVVHVEYIASGGFGD
jgi:hypothetical protein